MANKNDEDRYLYDAYVCHSNSEKDRTAINHIIDTLEQTPHNIRLCLPERDMSDVTDDVERGHLIQNSCKRLMIMLSPDHKEDSIRHVVNTSGIVLSSSSRRILPVVIERPCNVPESLKHYLSVDYTKEDVREWFFSRLAASLKH